MSDFLNIFESRRAIMFVYHYYFAVIFTGLIAGLSMYLNSPATDTHSYLFDLVVGAVFIVWAGLANQWTHRADRYVRFELPKRLHVCIHENTPYYTHEWLIYVYETRLAWSLLGVFSGLMLSANIYFQSEGLVISTAHPMYLLVYCFWFFMFFLALFSQRRMLVSLDAFKEAVANGTYDDPDRAFARRSQGAETGKGAPKEPT